MSRLILATLLALSCLLTASPAVAQTSTRDEIRLIEQEYARQSNGQMIPDQQLEYYLDRANSGWTMNQISQDMANSRRQYANSQWRPQSGWVAREARLLQREQQVPRVHRPVPGPGRSHTADFQVVLRRGPELGPERERDLGQPGLPGALRHGPRIKRQLGQ